MAFLRNLAARIALAGLCVAPALAQDLPPVAAPTTAISVGALPVLRSTSEEAGDFADGLIRGLMSAHRIGGMLFVAVRADHVMAAKGFGAGMDADTSIAVPCLDDVLRAIAIMQLVEQGRLHTNDDMSKVLGETVSRGKTVGEMLLHDDRADAESLAQAIERISGEAFPIYVMKHIFAPLGMMRSAYGREGFTTTANDASHLLLALANGGGSGQQRILLPETLDTMQRARIAAHPALPGRSYGFAEMRRNGHRALQHDGAAPAVQARIVLAPEARSAYLIVVAGKAGGQFWRSLDDLLFDRLLPPRAEESMPGGALPAAAEAQAAAGTYVAAPTGTAFLKSPHGRLLVAPGAGNTLLLSGAEEESLSPHAGDYWVSDRARIPAAYRGGRLLFGDVAYIRFPLWKRPELYAWLAVLFGLMSIFAFAGPARVQALTRLEGPMLRYVGPALAGAMFLLVLTAVALQLLV